MVTSSKRDDDAVRPSAHRGADTGVSIAMSARLLRVVVDLRAGRHLLLTSSVEQNTIDLPSVTSVARKIWHI